MIVLFSGLGSLACNWTIRRGRSLRTIALGVVAYAVVLYYGLDGILHQVFGWSVLVKAVLLAVIIAPLGFLMGQMFPLGLLAARRESTTIIPWAWGINGAMSTVVAGLAPLLAQSWGFNVLILMGIISYAAVLLLPTTRPPIHIFDHMTSVAPTLISAKVHT